MTVSNPHVSDSQFLNRGVKHVTLVRVSRVKSNEGGGSLSQDRQTCNRISSH